MNERRSENPPLFGQRVGREFCPMLFLVGCVVLSLGAPWSHSTWAEEPLGRSDEPQVVESVPAPIAAYCGVECLYRALRAMGKDVAFADLIEPEYIGSKQGSTAEELEQAGKDLGAYVLPMSRMTMRMLQRTKLPIILHVKTDLGADKYDHWVLFMGVVDGKAKIYDGQNEAVMMPFDELAARWSGKGLVVSDKPISSVPFQLGALGPMLLSVGLVALTVGMIRRVGQRRETTQRAGWLGVVPRTVAQAMGLLLIALAAMVATRISSPAGFLSHTSAIAAIQDANFGAFLPKVSTRELASLLDKDTVAIVDARLPVDFHRDHLQGAISVPVTSDPQQCQQAMSHVPKEKRIIVYSHSNGCDYGERVAKELMAQGYQDISLYRGGWVEWEKQYPPVNRVTQVAAGL